MIDDRTEYLKTKVDNIEASLNVKLDSRPTLHQLIYVVGGAVVTALVAVVAIVQYGSAQFQNGAQVTSSTYDQAHAAKEAADETKKLSEENARQIGLILDLLKRRIDEAPQQKKP